MNKILIVDDESIILEGIRSVLEESKLPFEKVITARESKEALSLFEKEKFDIVLTDISMPQMNGLDMAAHMKEIYPDTEILFLTAYPNFEYARQAIRLQSFDYLLKPIHDEELISSLEKVLAAIQMKRENRISVENEGSDDNTMHGNNGAEEAVSVNPETEDNFVIKRVLSYVQENPGSDLTLEQLSKRFRMNASYLSRSFHQQTGEALSAYITRIRMEEAKRLLRETDCKIHDIAMKTGYETQNYFSKVFNKYTGMSPKEYRMKKTMN